MNFTIFLKNFRSYISADFSFKKGINFICAPNGWGKTNLLEAISLLSPGRGLKKANVSEMINKNANFFSISVKFDSMSFLNENNTECEDSNLVNINYFGDNKQFSWNGGKISGTELIEEIGVFWLTPQIIFNFWKEPKVRRDFFDRIVANFIPSHLYNCAKYEKVRLNRSKLIKSGYSNKLTYQAMEKILIEEGMSMIQNRQKVAAMLNLEQSETVEHDDQEKLDDKMDAKNEIIWICKSKYRVRCIGFAESTPSELLKESWKKDLEENRFGREKFGPHKTNIIIEKVLLSTEIDSKIDSKMDAVDTKVVLTSELASTGQQHLMIINLILTAFKSLVQKIKILLLDDVLSHLDQKNRMLIMESINFNLLENYILITDTQIPFVEFEFNKIYLAKTS